MIRKVKNVFHLIESVLAAKFFGFPCRRLVIIGVTGTDGKSTTVSLISQILTAAGIKVKSLSTLSSAHTTTPGRGQIHQFLSEAVKEGCSHAVLEVSSHGIDQNRVWGVDFEIGVLTNIADNEHLDYHGSFKKYRQTKINFLKKCQKVIANEDDAAIEILKEIILKKRLVTYGIKNSADYRYVEPQNLASLRTDKLKINNLELQTPLIGQFNIYNLLAAVAACKTLGVEDRYIAEAVKSFKSLPGRMEIVVNDPFTVVVDFAHTPQAFENVLPLARGLMAAEGGRLIHVFGATGERDRSKRPIMGRVAAKYDDLIFLTSEDTYKEEPERILDEIEVGVRTNNFRNYQKVLNRRGAICGALQEARRGDVVIITGVGHQKSLNIGGKEIPWSDQEIVRDFMRLNIET